MPKALTPAKKTSGILPLEPGEASDLLVQQIEMDANTPIGDIIPPKNERDTGRKDHKTAYQRTRKV